MYITDMDRLQVIQQNKEAIHEIARQHGAHRLRVFGSVARGEAGPASDIDFLVQMDPDCSLLDQVGLIQDLQALLGSSVHVVTEKALHWYIRDRVLAEAVAL